MGRDQGVAAAPRHLTRAESSIFMQHLTHDEWFGKKTIGYFAGVALLINNITGPGVPSIPNIFVESGWLFPSVAFIAIWLMTTISTTMYCEAMRHIPGNENFRDRIEYSSIIEFFFGRKAYIAAQIGINGALQSLNIISVIQSVQVMDAAISVIFGKTCGLNLSPFATYYHPNSTATPVFLHESKEFWSCVDAEHFDHGNAWGCHLILSAGFLVCILIALPMGYFKLDDNMIIQETAFVITIISWLIWLVACFFSPNFKSFDDWSIAAVTDSSKSWASQAGVLGNILFNFGFVTTVPSWVNEKKPSVSVNKVVWLSTFLCVLIFFVMGLPPAMAFRDQLNGPATGNCRASDGSLCKDSLLGIFTSDELMPSVFRDSKAAKFILQLSVYLFSICAVLMSIPVFSIVIKYNCVENGFSHRFAFVWGVLFPWIVAIPLMWQPDALNQFITYSSLIFVSFTDFIVPWALYMKLQGRKKHKENNSERFGRMSVSALGNVQVGREVDVDGTNDASMCEETDPIADFESDVGFMSSHTADIITEVHTDIETTPLLGKKNEGQSEKKSGTPLIRVAPVHYALPPKWNLSPKTKFSAAIVLVSIMTIAAIAGTILQIITSKDMQWDCAAVTGN